jgi:uncharacterized FlaG/YvyC family protein
MRIDGSSPIPSTVSRPAVREVKPAPAVHQAAPEVKDHVEMQQQKPEVAPTNVLVEMHPGNIVVYKFIDEASGRLIQQIPSEQMIKLSQPVEAPKDKKRI